VIHLLEYFFHHDQLVIVLERPERCCDLHDFISTRSNGLDERLARDFFKQILQILQDVHSCGVSEKAIVSHVIVRFLQRFYTAISKMKIS
jgi:serine/threonine protein kinase